MRRFLLPALLAVSLPLSAADPGAKRYLAIKEDGDLYVGEGVAELKEFPASELKALEAARERARAALGGAIQVRVRSEISEQSSQGKEGSSEELSAKSSSIADLVLENVHSEDFIGLPKEGRITVLAWVSKEDYRRQLAGQKVPVYRHQWGFKAGIGPARIDSVAVLMDSVKDYVSPIGIRGTVDKSPIAFAPMVELGWQGWALGLQSWGLQIDTYDYSGSNGGGPGRHDYSFNALLFQAGYDITPWAWRLQPYAPLRLEGASVSLGPYSTFLSSATAGGGLRFWATDSLAVEAAGSYRFGLNSSTFVDKAGQELRLGSGAVPSISLSGFQLLAGLRWSGF
jgi:hypothetical protein